MATKEVKKLWAIVGGVMISVVALLVLAVVSGGKVRTPSEITLTDPVGAGDWTTPSSSGAVSLVEYSDYQCPACATYAPVVNQLVAEFGDQLAFTYRHFPLRNIHPNAQITAQAAEAAGKQNKFWEMSDLLFEKQSEWSTESDPINLLTSYAESLGLNTSQFAVDLRSEVVVDKVNKDFNSAMAAGLSYTPSFLLEGKLIPNPRNYEDFKALINEALAQKNNAAPTTASSTR